MGTSGWCVIDCSFTCWDAMGNQHVYLACVAYGTTDSGGVFMLPW